MVSWLEVALPYLGLSCARVFTCLIMACRSLASIHPRPVSRLNAVPRRVVRRRETVFASRTCVAVGTIGVTALRVMRIGIASLAFGRLGVAVFSNSLLGDGIGVTGHAVGCFDSECRSLAWCSEFSKMALRGLTWHYVASLSVA